MFIGCLIVQQIPASDIRRSYRTEVSGRNHHECNHEKFCESCILILRFTGMRQDISGKNISEGTELQESQRI